MAVRIIKIGVAAGVPVDTVEKLLTYASDGDELAVFTSEGEVVFVSEGAGDFEDIS